MRYWWVNQNQTYRAAVRGSSCGRRTKRERRSQLDAWGIDAGVRVGEFTREQSAYLDYHRMNVFKHALLRE
jgi:hypothetical protein